MSIGYPIYRNCPNSGTCACTGACFKDSEEGIRRLEEMIRDLTKNKNDTQ